jgi:hypothetical protein
MVNSPLFLPGWLAFNREKWGAEPVTLRLERDPANPPRLESVIYLDRKQRVWLPPLNYYLPVAFTPTPTQSGPSRYRQWLEMTERLAGEMGERGLHDRVALPPEVADVRAWQWAGFRVSARYTFYLDLPYDTAQLDAATRKNIVKGQKNGFRDERTTDMDAVMACLEETELRQGFRHRLDATDLVMLRELMGDEHLRAYVCYAPNGEPAATKVVLHRPGGRAVVWLSGTRAEYLSACATQLQFLHVLEDLHAAGAVGCDFAGANLPGVALSKSKWGGTLVPFFTVESPGLMGLARYVRDYWTHRRQRGPCTEAC